ncbi:MAG: hypothetical protein U5K36_15975 [Roseovarius sp.]|nr:hypothetical protein [Roseovarius sp.]
MIVALAPEFPTACALAQAHVPENGIVRFPLKKREFGPTHRNQRRVAANSAEARGAGDVRADRHWGAPNDLLAATRRFDRPVDTFLQLRWVHGADMLSVWPSGISEVSDDIGGSTIHQRMASDARLKREILRPLYRLSVRFKSFHHRNDA